MDIKEARKQIDSIDAVLVAEFEKRLSLIKEIGKYKDEHHLPLVDRKSTRLNSSHIQKSRMPSSA